jgi:hypothetical protein
MNRLSSLLGLGAACAARSAAPVLLPILLAAASVSGAIGFASVAVGLSPVPRGSSS